MKTPLLEVQELSCSYETSQYALQNVNARIYPGEKIAVLGSNGAGKSTFFLSLNGIIKPSAGRILLNGTPVQYDRKGLLSLRRKVGVVFQDPDTQIIASTVAGEISFGPMNLRLGKEEVRRRTEQAMNYMELDDFAQRSPHYLSGGEKKRVSIADIVAMGSEIFLFDEPTASLDPKNTLLLEETLTRLNQDGSTILVSTHDLDFALRWANRILVFHRGQLIGDNTPEKIFSDRALLIKANLREPLLFQVGQLLKETGVLPHASGIPICIEELRQLLNKTTT